MKNKFSLLFLLLAFVQFGCHQKKQEPFDDDLYRYRDYISYVSNDYLSTLAPIQILLAQEVEQYELNQEIPAKYVKVTPAVKGKLYISKGKTLEFQPEKRLQPNTEYRVTLLLSSLFENVDPELKNFNFSFKTIEPGFKINLEKLQSHNSKTQFLEGYLESADYIDYEWLPKLMQASQEGKTLPVKWDSTENQAKYFKFTIDDIERKAEDSHLKVSWNGKSINAATRGETEYEIPGYNNFKITAIKAQYAPSPSLHITFSDELDPDQDFSGLVQLEKVNQLKFEVEKNRLHVYPGQQIHGEIPVTLHPGIKRVDGKKLKEEYTELVAFEQLKPGVEMISKGVILPQSASTPLYFKTVNLNAVDVRVIKIYEDNVLQFLQEHNLNETSVYNIRKTGKRVAKKTLRFAIKEEDRNQWKAHALKLSDFFKADPGALYQVELSFRPSYSTYECLSGTLNQEAEEWGEVDSEKEELQEERYWNNEIYSWRDQIWDWQNQDNPCYPVYYQEQNFVTTNLLGSDLGLIVKKGGDNSYTFYSTNILSAQPESRVRLHLYDYQQQEITTLETDSNGEAEVKTDRAVAFVVAKKGNDYAYAKTDDGNSLSMSKFDISGNELQKGLKGFIYTDRGVHRPGDQIHLTFVLNDKENPLPQDVPVKIEVENARGKIVQRTVSSEGESSLETRGKNRFYYFPIPTKDSDETGNWLARISVGGAVFTKTLPVASVKPNRLRIKLDFDEEIIKMDQPISGLLTGTWLHGAIARNLKADMEVTLTTEHAAFENFEAYNFTDPVRKFEKTELSLLETQLSNEGTARFNKPIKIDRKAPGMLRATFLTKLYEGGGDFSLDVDSKKMAPYAHFVGLKSPETKDYGNYYTDETNSFDVVSVDADGKIATHRKLDVQVFKIEWRWWWYSGEDNLSRYEDATVHRPFEDFEIETDAQGKASFNLTIPDADKGRFLIRIKDKESGHATGRTAYFYKDWWANDDKNADNAHMLVFKADKESYQVGETAHLTFPSSSVGNALVSIESGTAVLSTQWVKTNKGETAVQIPITPEMAPNVYVNISLLQPHDQVKNDLPIRLYGVIPLTVEDPLTILKPKIDMPKELQPEEAYTIKVSEENKKPMTYTLAIVDEGLLDLTRFSTPNIHRAFYNRQALGVKTFDIYDYIIGAYSGSVNNIYEIGGDDVAESGKKNKANRFKPVVTYLGPFELKPGETQSHEIEMPNYIGSVRTMLIAGNVSNSSYGSTEETTPVKKPLMVLSSLPRKLSPGETLTLPVTVFAMDDKIKNVQVNVQASDAFEAVNGNSQQLRFEKPDEKIVNFQYRVQPSEEVQKFAIQVSGNGEKASTEVEIDVENPNVYSHQTTPLELAANAQQTFNYSPFGVDGTNSVKLEVSTLPPMDFTKRLQYLIHYPHGCVEQTTSTAFPQLYLDEVFDLTVDRKTQMDRNIKATIQKVGDAQLSTGGIPFWPGENQAHDWNTSYAGHFMLEAKEKGYALPISFLNNWLRYQQNEARSWSLYNYDYNSSFAQAYRLYTLALAGQPELATMNRLRESPHLTREAKWRLAAAYALAGKKEIAKQMIEHTGYDFEKQSYDYHYFASPFRNKAMALETMVLIDHPDQRELAAAIAKEMNRNTWMSTQETSYGLLAMAKMVRKNGGKGIDISLVQDGKTIAIKTDKAIAERSLNSDFKENSVQVKNNADNLVYLNLYQEGKPELGKEENNQRNLSAILRFVDGEDQTLSVDQIKQGTEIKALISVRNTSDSFINDVALTQPFPSGWEIINTSFTELRGGVGGDADYVDIRDDRVYFYFDLAPGKTKTFSVKLNASYLGKYYLPGTYAEGMYDHNYYVQTKGQWIEVEL